VSPLEFPPRRADVFRLRPRPQTASRLKAELQRRNSNSRLS